MEGTTSQLASKTIWGAIIAVLAGVAGLFGLNLDASLQDQLAQLIASAATLVGGALAWYGRVTATKKIG